MPSSRLRLVPRDDAPPPQASDRFASVLTLDELKLLAGDWFPRGEAYHRQGKVKRLELSSSDVQGWVRGRDLYRVRLYVAPPHSELGFQCSCPLGEAGIFCKHAIALGLAALEAWSQAKAARPPPLAPAPAQPKNERLRPLWASLSEVRAAHARRSRQRRAPDLRALDVDLDPDVPGISVTFPAAHVARGWAWAEATVELSWVRGRLQWACDCERSEACGHLLGAVDAVLVSLNDPTREELLVRIAEEAFRPEWDKALTALEQLATAEESKKAVEPVRCSWTIHDEGYSVTLQPLLHKRNKKGNWSSGSRIRSEKVLRQYAASLEPADLRVCSALAAHRYREADPTPLLESLVGHPRVFLSNDAVSPVQVKRALLGFVVHENDGQFSIAPALNGLPLDDKERRRLERVFHSNPTRVLVQPQARTCWLVDVNERTRGLLELLTRHGASFPKEAAPRLAEQLFRLSSALPWTLPESLKGEQVIAPPVAVLTLRLDESGEPLLRIDARFRALPGATARIPGEGPVGIHGTLEGRRVFARREIDQEPSRMRELLARLPMDGAIEGSPFSFVCPDPERSFAAMAAIQALGPGAFETVWEGARRFAVSALGPESLQVKVERQRDWFGLSGGAKVDGHRLDLAVLLDAARRKKRFVQLEGERWAELTEALRARLASVADHAFASTHGLETSPAATQALAELEEAGVQVSSDKAWRALATRVEKARSFDPELPTGLQANLRDYQRDGFRWMARLAEWGAGACLADDMGLGKTLQTLALLTHRAAVGPALVVAPTSVCFNWREEARKFAPGLKFHLYAEQDKRQAKLKRLRAGEVLVTSYGLLTRDDKSFAAKRFATLVLDEAQAVKNAQSLRARATQRLNADFRVALSGTPLENHLGELWSLFRVAFPGLLGSWEQFRERYAGPIERSRDLEASAGLARVVRPFLLRRTKAEVAKELPPKTEIQLNVTLSSEERAMYEDARLAAVAELGASGEGLREEQKRFQVLAALTRLRLLASHPKLYDETSPVASSKMCRLLELLRELKDEGHRCLVFSQFTSHLSLVRSELDREGIRYQYLDGGTPAVERGRRVQAFQGGEGDVFLISLKAGGTGLNLTAADYVVHLDPWWNPAVEDQASDRAHRMGQTQPVTIYRLVAQGTIEEQILAMHGEKRALISGVLEGTGAAAKLDSEALLALLRGAGSSA